MATGVLALKNAVQLAAMADAAEEDPREVGEAGAELAGVDVLGDELAPELIAAAPAGGDARG